MQKITITRTFRKATREEFKTPDGKPRIGKEYFILNPSNTFGGPFNLDMEAIQKGVAQWAFDKGIVYVKEGEEIIKIDNGEN